MTNISRTDFPALDGRAVTEAHDRICAERGHARHTRNGKDSGLCPRCGRLTLPALAALTLGLSFPGDKRPNGAGKCWKSSAELGRTPWFATDQHGHIRAYRTWVEALAWANTHEH
jgi:hypothetical protein